MDSITREGWGLYSQKPLFLESITAIAYSFRNANLSFKQLLGEFFVTFNAISIEKSGFHPGKFSIAIVSFCWVLLSFLTPTAMMTVLVNAKYISECEISECEKLI
jgi:hypothetical protein